jgi:anti-sigma B factor antagonist
MDMDFAADDPDGSLGRENLNVEQYWLGQVVVIAVSGAVDMLTSPWLNEAIDAAAAQSPLGMIIDLTKTDFLASAGLSALVRAQQNLTPTARLGIVADGPATSRPITLVGLDSVLTLYRTLDDALHDISGE